VRDEEDETAVANATVTFNGTLFSGMKTSEVGRFYKILAPGFYRITVTADNYETQTQARVSDFFLHEAKEPLYSAFDLFSEDSITGCLVFMWHWFVATVGLGLDMEYVHGRSLLPSHSPGLHSILV